MNTEDQQGSPPESPRDKSAKSKFITPKTNAAKEIQSWAQSKSDRRLDYARQSGQLSDNVTEERMLQSKIMELSKERYKFMSQNAYERKVFLDRQQRKTNVMKDLLKGIDVEKYVRRAGVICSDMDPSTPRKEVKLTGRLGLLSRLDPTKKTVVKNAPQNEDKEPHLRPQTTMPSIKKNEPGISRGKVLPKTANAAVRRNESRVNFSSTVNTLPDLTWDRKNSRGTPMSMRKDSIVSITSFDNDSGSPISRASRRPLSRSNTTGSLRGSGKVNSEKKSRSVSYPNNRCYGPTTDPRYFLLTKSLCDNYNPCLEITADEIDGVISKIDTLHTPARRVREAKGRPKMTFKLQEFMRERGLVLQ